MKENKDLSTQEILRELLQEFTAELAIQGILIFFVGQSGAGKDFQSKLFVEFLRRKNRKFLYQANGDEFRWFFKNSTQTSRVRHVMLEKEKLQQRQNALMPLLFMFSMLKESYTGDETVIVNGSPRSEEEFNHWLSFVDGPSNVGLFKRIVIINLEISDDEALARMMNRPNRSDSDTEEKMKRKMAWYGEVREFLATLRENSENGAIDTSRYWLIDVDSGQDKLTVARDVLNKLSL